MSGEPPRCPYCGESRLIEAVGRVYFCNVCGKEFGAPVRNH